MTYICVGFQRIITMSTNQDAPRESSFVKAGRFLGRSRAGRLFLSLGIATLFCGAAYTAWHERELAAWALAAWLVVYGLQLAWDLLPISEATRIRWAEDRKKVERCPASRFRSMLWTGIAVGLVEWLGPDGNKRLDWSFFIFPGALVAVGVVSYILCRRYVYRERKT